MIGLLCSASGCPNASKHGTFVGDLCALCHHYLARNYFNSGWTEADWGRLMADEAVDGMFEVGELLEA